MYDHEKSDPAIVAAKPSNKAGQPAAELVEPRAGAEGNVSQQSTGRAQYRGPVSQALERIRQAARQRKKEKFTTLLHHVSTDHLEEAFFELKKNAAPGVDGLTCRDYEQHLESNLEDLHARVHRGAYRALPSRRVYIPKPDGRQRPIAVAALEDKIVQRATAAVLSAIYEEDFLGFSVLQRQIERREHETITCRIAAWKMGAGPPGSAFRSGSQTTPSGCGQKPWS
jgi:RNA-directed DNA polymerase